MNTTRQLVAVMASILMMISLTGCGTLFTHVDGAPTDALPRLVAPSKHYAGVGIDISNLKDAVLGLYPDATSEQQWATIISPLSLADLPLSSIADTILLPFDKVQNPVTNAPPNTALEPTPTAP